MRDIGGGGGSPRLWVLQRAGQLRERAGAFESQVYRPPGFGDRSDGGQGKRQTSGNIGRMPGGSGERRGGCKRGGGAGRGRKNRVPGAIEGGSGRRRTRHPPGRQRGPAS